MSCVMRNSFNIALVLVSLAGNAARATIPTCAKHMAEAGPGQVLTPSQVAINQSCLTELQMESAATDLQAHISENERKIAGKKGGLASNAIPISSGVNELTNSSNFVTAGSGKDSPRIVAIYSKGRRLYATLRDRDGSTVEISNGAKARNGGHYRVSPTTVSLENASGLESLDYDIALPTVPQSMDASTMPVPQIYRGQAQ